jgi:hypothetical protein
MTRADDPTQADLLGNASWFKSSYSDNHGGACVELAALSIESGIAVRDSKAPDGPAILFPQSAWTAFVTGVKSSKLDGKRP